MKTSPLVIMHVTAPAAFGGLESVVRLLARAQVAQGDIVHVVAMLSAPGDACAFTTDLAASGATVHEVYPGAGGILGERRTLRSLAGELKPHVVHTHGYRADVLVASLARREGLATVSTLHGFTGGSPRVRAYEWIQRMALRRAHAVVAVSGSIRMRMLGAGMRRDRLHLIPNALDAAGGEAPSRSAVREELQVATGDRVVGWIGRLSHEKGADVLINALPLLPPDVSVAIVGDGPERDHLIALARTLDVGQRVRWLGAIPTAARLIPGFDVFALTSRTEGSPMVLLEAMASRSPIVAAAVGGVPDIVSDREALLIPTEDASALACAIRRVFDDPEDAARRVELAHRKVMAAYAVAPWVERYRTLYRGLGRA